MLNFIDPSELDLFGRMPILSGLTSLLRAPSLWGAENNAPVVQGSKNPDTPYTTINAMLKGPEPAPMITPKATLNAPVAENKKNTNKAKGTVTQGENNSAPKSGAMVKGNIDLSTRPVVKNEDGSISTVKSISVDFDGKTYLIPTISDDGRVLSTDEAIQMFKKTKRHLGMFPDASSADEYAKQLSHQQGVDYGAADPVTFAQRAVNGTEQSSSSKNDPVSSSTEDRYQQLLKMYGIAPNVSAAPNGMPDTQARQIGLNTGVTSGIFSPEAALEYYGGDQSMYDSLARMYGW